jgi:lipopolysaccharide export system permease protein
MKTLHRYILREHIGPLFFALVILVSILLMNQIVLLFDKIVGKGLSWVVILEVFGLCIPFILATTMPMAVLVATMYAFGRLSSDNEIVAMKAGGISLFSIIRPLIFAALLLTILMAWFNNSILPETNYWLRSILLDISYQKPTLEIKEGILMDNLSGYSLLVQRVNRQDSRLYDVTIYDATSEGAPRTILANEGEMAFSENREDLVLTLKNGEIHQVDPENIRNYQRIEFQTQVIVIRDVGRQFERRQHGTYRTDREMSSSMMAGEVQENQNRIASITKELREKNIAVVDSLFLPSLLPESRGDINEAPVALSEPAELAIQHARKIFLTAHKRQREIEALIKRNDQLLVEIYKKFSIPFASIVFIVLGAPLRLNFKSGGTGTVIVLSLVTFTSYYIFLTGGENLADRGLVDPFLAMWAPNLLFGLLGIALLFKTVRETSFLSLDILNPVAWFRREERDKEIEGH